MHCAPICAREIISRDPGVSPGVVGSDEEVYRALFPSQRKAGVVKKSAITASHLWDGQLSVWRLGKLVALDLDQLIELLEPLMVRPSNGEKFDQLRAAKVSVIRALQMNEERGFSVIDECDLDAAG